MRDICTKSWQNLTVLEPYVKAALYGGEYTSFIQNMTYMRDYQIEAFFNTSDSKSFGYMVQL